MDQTTEVAANGPLAGRPCRGTRRSAQPTSRPVAPSPRIHSAAGPAAGRPRSQLTGRWPGVPAEGRAGRRSRPGGERAPSPRIHSAAGPAAGRPRSRLTGRWPGVPLQGRHRMGRAVGAGDAPAAGRPRSRLTGRWPGVPLQGRPSHGPRGRRRPTWRRTRPFAPNSFGGHRATHQQPGDRGRS